MRIVLRFIGFLIVLGIVMLDIWIYHNDLRYSQAQKTADAKKKIQILEKVPASRYAHDQIFYELGKAYFELGMDSIERTDASSTYLEQSIQNFNQAIAVNPASEFAHFRLGQSLSILRSLDQDFDINPYEEYRKAVLLTGFNSQIFLEVGKQFLSRWAELPEAERTFALEILKKILSTKDKRKLKTILHYWDMNVHDYTLIESIMPEDARMYRVYADFLGEKSLSLTKRQDFLASAEFLEYQQAKSFFAAGENDLLYFRLKPAQKNFQRCLETLEKIHFYQDLRPGRLIDLQEFLNLRKSTLIKLAQTRLYSGERLKDVLKLLELYLAMEREASPANELWSFLENRGFLEEKTGTYFDDLELLLFKLHLLYKLNRYREIMKIGRLIEQSLVVVPKQREKKFGKILRIVGDAYQRSDNIYDASEFYAKALEIDPEDIETLVRVLQNFRRRNDEAGILQTSEKIERVIDSQEKLVERLIQKGQEFTLGLVLDGEDITVRLHFERVQGENPPLVTVLFNSRVIRENFLTTEFLSFPLQPGVGRNELMIIPVNRPVFLKKLTYERSSPDLHP